MRGLIILLFLAAAFVSSSSSGQSLESDNPDSLKAEKNIFKFSDEYIKDGDLALLADRRVFAVMTFHNAMGYDDERWAPAMHPIRVKVRELVKAKLSEYQDKYESWKNYWKDKEFKEYNCEDYALSLTSSYPFKMIYTNDQTGYPWKNKWLADFPVILNDFWITAGLDKIWDEVKPEYINEIRKFDFGKMRKELSYVWEYLRLEKKDSAIVVGVPDLMCEHYQAIGAYYDKYIYFVDGPGAGTDGLDIHEYLHHFINPMVMKIYNDHSSKLDKYFEAGKNGKLSEVYTPPVTFATECLVRALDGRIEFKLDNADRQKDLENQNAEGLNLILPFYRLLEDYEKSNMDFEKYLPVLFSRLEEYKKN